jgi:hypothetical protein
MILTPEPPTYARTAVVTIDEVAAALRVSVKSILRMDLPTVYVGRMKRYVWGQILDELSERATKALDRGIGLRQARRRRVRSVA